MSTTPELERQMEYISKIKDYNDNIYLTSSCRPKMFIHTYGCQMNAHDSEKIRGMLLSMGYTDTPDEKDADLIIYNTCCIRENAENRVYGNLGYLKHFKEKKPGLKIALCGCMTQQDTAIEKLKASYRHVDIIFGTFNLYKFPELLMTNIETNSRIIDIWDKQREIVEDLPTKREFSYKASVNIMYGCNNFCSYCIVPYVRGRERSRSITQIISEIKSLVADGVKEILLLGQNVNSYNDPQGSGNFSELLREVNNVEGIDWIRFMTSHPKDLSDELISTVSECEHVCRHIHLPFQSGSTAILDRMNRKYTKEDYLALVDKIRARMPGIAITTDIIVGFPGETEQDFRDTLDVIERVRFSGAFTFIYSKRTGTPAATYDDVVPDSIINDRFKRLLNKLEDTIYNVNQSVVGKTELVLTEKHSGKTDNVLTGRTSSNALVHFEGSSNLIGKIVPVIITENRTFYFKGELEQ